MNNTQKKKRSIRSSKAWRDFRKKMMHNQHDRDLLTGTKLTGKWCVHHRMITDDEEVYGDLSHLENYLACLKSVHDTIHLCLRYVKHSHSMEFMDRLYEEIKQEAILNGYI